MPVILKYGDILGLDVDAIAIPHAPNDCLPFWKRGTIEFWDITADVLCRANMGKIMCLYNEYHGNGYKIGTDFLDDEDIGKTSFSMIKYPEITVTKCCGLPVNTVFHVCVKSYTEFIYNSSDAVNYTDCAEKEEYMLSRCYWMTLNCAERMGIKKIAFPLYSTDCPREIAHKVANSVPQKWLDEKMTYDISRIPPDKSAYEKLRAISELQASQMTIYLVRPNNADILRMKALREGSSDHKPFLSEFEQRFKREMSEFNGSAEAFKLNFIQTCFEKYIRERKGTYSALAEKTNYGNSDISKLKNGDTKKVRRKETAIALAVAMELGDYERFAFINCTNNKYPADEMDLLVEKLISDGKRDLEELKEALYRINKSYDLYGGK